MDKVGEQQGCLCGKAAPTQGVGVVLTNRLASAF